uniref:DUF4220 domain-containing protein n=2 Tax=Setaria viridis TaxID=4556 RepID=A0A4U6TBX1_SETVI|nr:hypothetical protein SEVIR_8G051500v2 [Setaria viridis]
MASSSAAPTSRGEGAILISVHLSQVTVAIYVFWKSWTSPSEETILWKTTLLVFAPEILKCFEKPWALKNASITSLTSMWRPVENGEINTLEAFVEAACHLWWDNQPNNEGPPLEPNNEGPPLEPNNEGPPLEPNNNEGPPLEPNNNEGPPLEPNNEGPPLEPNNNEGPPLEPNNEGPPLQPNDEERKPYTLFVDIVYSYDDRLRNLSYILRNTDDEVYGAMLRFLVAYLIVQAIKVFDTGNYSGYNQSDVMVTYILLVGTTVLEYLIANVKPFLECCGIVFKLPWPTQVAQYNLIGYMARNRRHRGLRKLATLLVCKDTLDQLWSMEPCRSSIDITNLVYEHVQRGWQERITDAATYISFNDCRGQRTLERENQMELLVHINRPFDEAVLIWHLATDFCFHSMVVDAEEEIIREMSRTSRQISNYLMYLLFVNPEMLMTGTRSRLFKTAYGNLKRMIRLNAMEEPMPNDRDISASIIAVPPGERLGLIRDALGLADELRGPAMQAAVRWRIIQGVWVEMLCFSAGRCRGYLHAKGLGKGGEYLSHVWLLLSYMGMETLAERLQRTE